MEAMGERDDGIKERGPYYYNDRDRNDERFIDKRDYSNGQKQSKRENF